MNRLNVFSKFYEIVIAVKHAHCRFVYTASIKTQRLNLAFWIATTIILTHFTFNARSCMQIKVINIWILKAQSYWIKIYIKTKLFFFFQKVAIVECWLEYERQMCGRFRIRFVVLVKFVMHKTNYFRHMRHNLIGETKDSKYVFWQSGSRMKEKVLHAAKKRVRQTKFCAFPLSQNGVHCIS